MKSKRTIRKEIQIIEDKIAELKPEDTEKYIRLAGVKDALTWALAPRGIIFHKYLPIPELNLHIGRFTCGIGEWSYGWIFSTDCYGLRGIDLYVGTWFHLWILWDTNKYNKEVAR